MKPRDEYFSREARYSLGVDEDSGFLYLSIPVSNAVADYEEYYRLSPEEYSQLLASQPAAIRFAEECRSRRHDDRLIQKPGWNRGTPV